MRRTLSLLASSAAVVGLFAAFSATPATAAACPSDMQPVPASFVRQGEKKDHNANGVVCAKVTTCLQSSGVVCQGGPDDQLYLMQPLLGSDGSWYYVIDDTP